MMISNLHIIVQILKGDATYVLRKTFPPKHRYTFESVFYQKVPLVTRMYTWPGTNAAHRQTEALSKPGKTKEDWQLRSSVDPYLPVLPLSTTRTSRSPQITSAGSASAPDAIIGWIKNSPSRRSRCSNVVASAKHGSILNHYYRALATTISPKNLIDEAATDASQTEDLYVLLELDCDSAI